MDRKRVRSVKEASPKNNRRIKVVEAERSPEPTLVQFYSKSKDIDDLGRLGDGGAPVDLGMPNWRKVLSNFHAKPVTVKHKTYPTLEHCFHACKALCSTKPAYADEFQVHGSIGPDPLHAKRAGSRAGFARAGATLNVSQWIQLRDQYMARGLKARAKQQADFRRILIMTQQRNLHLLHFERSGQKSYWGGSVDKATGQVRGTNRLGELLMMLRDVITKEEDHVGQGETNESQTSQASDNKNE